jgi:hypothetical protein
MSIASQVTVCLLISAVSDTKGRYKEMSDELVRGLEDLGLRLCKAFRPVTDPNRFNRTDEKSRQLSYLDYWTSGPVPLQMPKIYVAMPNDASLLSALSGILSGMGEDKGCNPLIILMPSSYWSGFLSWLKESARAKGEVNRPAIDSIVLVDTVVEAISVITSREPSPQTHG